MTAVLPVAEQAPQRPLTRVAMVVRVGHIAVPILLSSLAGLFAPLVNAAVMGWHDGSYLYVLALVLPVILLQNSVNESLRVSSVAFSSQASGSGDLATFRRRLRGLVTLGVGVNLSVALLFLAGNGAFMDLYAVAEGRRRLTFEFIQLNILTGTLLMVSMATMAALYGFGQVRAVTIATIASLGANVALVAVMVNWIGLFAMPAATALTAGTTIWWASRRLGSLGASPWGAKIPGAFRSSWREITRISLPVSLGYVLLFVNSMLFTRVLAGYAPADLAGFGVAYRIQNLVVMPAIALGIGLAINVNRMVAAGVPQVVSRFTTTVVGLSLGLFVILGGLVFVTRSLTAAAMTADPAIAGAAAQYLSYLAPAFAVVGPMLTLLIFLEETGNGFRALTFNAAFVAAQLGLAFYLARSGHPLSTIYGALAATYVVAIAFIVHELIRAHRLGGRVSMISPT